MLLPKKVKYRKWQKGRKRNQGVSTRGTQLSFGSYGLKSQGYAWLTSRQIEAARRVLSRYTKRTGKVWIRVFPDKPVTKKGAEVPMGKGKGAVDHYVCVIKPGAIIFELDGVPEADAKSALQLAAHKLPFKTKFISKN
jgi:large subunit ribosomal protein L16